MNSINEPTKSADVAEPERCVRHESGRTVFYFVGIVIVAFTLRFIHLQQAARLPFFGSPISDAKSYDDWASRIVAGDWIGHEVFYQAPAYPYFLAIVKLVVGSDSWNIRMVQAILGSVACGLLYLAGKRFFCRTVGMLAGVMMACYPPAIFFDGLIQKAVLDFFFMCLLLFLLARLNDAKSAGAALLAGIVLGCFALTRENVLLFFPIIILWLIFDRSVAATEASGRRWRAAALFTLGAVVVLTPVGLRNRHIGGAFLITTAQFGPNFFIGNNPAATGAYSPLRGGRGDPQFERNDATDLAQRAVGHTLSPAEVSAYWTSEALAFIRHRPLAWIKLLGRKCMLLINAYEIPDSEDIYYYMGRCSLIGTIGTFWHFGILAPLAILGMSLSWSRIRELWILHALLMALAVGIALFYVFARYRFPMMPILALLAAGGIVEGWRLIASGDIRHVGAAVAVGLFLALPINWPMARASDAASHANAGTALFQEGKYAAAIPEYEKALAINPSLSSAQVSLANAYWREGRVTEAIEAFRKAIELRPADAENAVNLGSILVKVGRLDEAEHYLRTGLQVASRRPEVYTSLGILLARKKNWEEAFQVLNRGAREAPHELTILANLAWNLATCPQDKFRDGKLALQYALTCCEKTNFNEPGALDILAAAYAELGSYQEAVSAEQRALQIASSTPGAYPVDDFQARLNLYQSGKPYRRP